jgi:hypothetical protein
MPKRKVKKIPDSQYEEICEKITKLPFYNQDWTQNHYYAETCFRGQKGLLKIEDNCTENKTAWDITFCDNRYRRGPGPLFFFNLGVVFCEDGQPGIISDENLGAEEIISLLKWDA